MSEQNENEILARWLGWTNCTRCNNEDPTCAYLTPPGGVYQEVPDFRSSNEWAGALLEKLGPYCLTIDTYTDEDGDSLEWIVDFEIQYKSYVTTSTASWRDAVVDAALQVIRRESQVDESSTQLEKI